MPSQFKVNDRVMITTNDSTMKGMAAVVRKAIEKGVFIELESFPDIPMYFRNEEVCEINDLVVCFTLAEAQADYYERTSK